MRCKQMMMIATGIMLMLTVLPFPVASEENTCLQPEKNVIKPGTSVADGGFMSSMAGLFKRHVSPIDGDRCPMYPSCSRYSQDAFHKHGLVMGWVMTCDRLLRCGRDELATTPRIITEGGTRYYDSVENNDFWWSK